MRWVSITNAGGDGRRQRGGAEVAVAELAAELDRRGHEAHIVGPRSYLDEIADQVPATVGLHSNDVSVRAFPGLVRLLGEIAPDAVCTHLLRGTLLGLPASVLARTPVRVSNLHNSLEQALRHSGLGAARIRSYRGAFRVLVNRASRATIAISPANAEDLLSTTGIRPSRVVVIPNWIGDGFRPEERLARRAGARRRMGLPSDAAVLGVVGRFEHQKNQALAIDLVRRLAREDAVLVLVGAGKDEERLRAQAERVRPAHRVELRPYAADVVDAMSAFDVLLVPSRYEGFGKVAAEGLALGVPVIASDVDGLPFVLEGVPEAMARLAPPDDVAAWVAHARVMLGAPPSETVRAQVAREVRTRFSKEAAVDQYEALQQGAASAAVRSA